MTTPFVFVPVVILDQAVVAVIGGVIPDGSTITFRFYETGDCSGDFTEETVPVPAGGTSAVVLSSERLITDVAPKAYRAIFTSGDPDLVASAESACEPITFGETPFPYFRISQLQTAFSLGGYSFGNKK
jgi:hypothetical protein